MNETHPRDIVQAYLDAIEARDFARARTCLHDTTFSYLSPIAEFDDADTFIHDILRVGPILEGIERRHTFAEGNLVCSVLDFKTRMAQVETNTVVQLSTVSEGRISVIEAIFDASEYLKMFGVD